MILDVGFADARKEGPFREAVRFASREIPDGERVDVYGLNVDAHRQGIEAFEDVLSPHERAEVDRLRRPQQRRRVAISRGTLRWILAGYLGRPPADVPLSREPRGKPYVDFAASGECRRLHVSCSRSGPHAIFAIASGQPIGIDIEVANVENFPDQIAEIMLSPPERNQYAALLPGARAAWLARAWVAKEAILKGLGCGLEIPPGSINVATQFVADASTRALAWEWRAVASPKWWLCESAWGQSVVALAIRRRPSSLRFVDLTQNHEFTR